MKKLLLAAAFLLTTAVQIAVTADIYSRLNVSAKATEEMGEVVAHYANQSAFIESTVVRHDEEIQVLKQVKK